MEGKNFVPNNTSADLSQSWHIPRPTLARSSHSSQGSTSGSTNSTQSAHSGSLLLTAANLAQIHKEATTSSGSSKPTTNRDENLKYYMESTNDQYAITIDDVKKCRDPDSVSMASSMHFTVVNVNSRPQVKTRSFCKKHQLTVLVVTMSFLFTIGIITAIFLLEMRARRQLPH